MEVRDLEWGLHCSASQLSLRTILAAAQRVIQDMGTCPRLGQPQTQRSYMGKSALQAPAWLLQSMPSCKRESHMVDWCVLCPCVLLPGQGKVLSSQPWAQSPRQGLCPSPAFLSAAEGVFLLPSSLCRAGFAGDRMVFSNRECIWQLEEGVFINNKLTVIAISTTATPRSGKVPNHAGP